jgi:hypothetical protein
MRLSTAFIALSMTLFMGCYEEPTTCVSELACANQEGLIATCCGPGDDGMTSCWYEAPDGTVFACDPIEDEASAEGFCAQAVEDLTAHCSE